MMALDEAERFLERNPRARTEIELIPFDLVSKMEMWRSTPTIDCPDDFRVNLVEVYHTIKPKPVTAKPVSKRLTRIVRDWLRQER